MLQACLNGARGRDFHLNVPVSAAELAQAALACRMAGADEIHMHPRDVNGLETFSAGSVAEALLCVQAAVPGMPIGLSTREGILASTSEREAAFAGWSVLPDYVSVNLSEADAPDVIRQMLKRGVGIEAGLATAADAKRFVTLPEAGDCLRILIEIEEQGTVEAEQAARAVIAVLDAAGLKLPRQLHGFDDTQWLLHSMALELGYDRRIGFEDGRLLPDGAMAKSNAEMIAHAVLLADAAMT